MTNDAAVKNFNKLLNTHKRVKNINKPTKYLNLFCGLKKYPKEPIKIIITKSHKKGFNEKLIPTVNNLRVKLSNSEIIMYEENKIFDLKYFLHES